MCRLATEPPPLMKLVADNSYGQQLPVRVTDSTYKWLPLAHSRSAEAVSNGSRSLGCGTDAEIAGPPQRSSWRGQPDRPLTPAPQR